VRALVVPIAIAVFALAPAAADETVLGRTMAVSDPLPGVNTTTRIVQVVANEARATDEVLVGDPLADGASLEVIVNGATYGARHPADACRRTDRPRRRRGVARGEILGRERDLRAGAREHPGEREACDCAGRHVPLRPADARGHLLA